MDAASGSQAFASSSQAQFFSQKTRRRRPRCEQCGTNRFRRDTGTSLVVCEFGHVLQGFRDEEAQDGDEFNTSRKQMSRRNLKVQGRDKSGKRGRKKRSVATVGVWHGSRSRFLYFQCLQLILRMQTKALLKEIPGLPEEVEPICRDLWAMYTSLRSDLIPQPYLEGNEMVEEDLGSLSDNKADRNARRAAQMQAEREAILAQEEEESDTLHEKLREAGLTIEDDDDYHQGGTRDIEASSPDWESTGEDRDEDTEGEIDLIAFAPKKRNRKGRRRQGLEAEEGRFLKRHGKDRLDDLLCILHLALITLRVPMVWNDLYILMKAGRLPFLNVVHQLPAEMVAPLPPREVRGLDPSRLPSIRALHQSTVALSIDLYDRFGIEFPELNVLPILWKLTERLLLPPTFYAATKSLLSYIAVPMHTVPVNSSAFPHKTNSTGDVDRPMLDPRLIVSLGKRSTAREVIVVAGIILVIKMRYGLDGDERFEEYEEPSLWSGAPPLSNWLMALDETEKRLQSDFTSVFDPQGFDLLDMKDDHLDAYLAFAERFLILKQRPRAYEWRRREGVQDLLSCASHLDARYPLDETMMHDESSLLKQPADHLDVVIEDLYKNNPATVPESILLSTVHLRPGDAHSIYPRGKNDLQSLHADYKRVLYHASKLVGITPNELEDAVYSVEISLIKLLTWRRKRREAEEKQRLREVQGKRKPGRPRKNPTTSYPGIIEGEPHC